MTVMKFTAALVAASTRYTLSTTGYITVGQVTELIAQQENRIAAGTLELARPLQAYQSLQDIGFQAGDRLAIFTQPTRPAELYPPLRPGDKILHFFLRDDEVSSRGKKMLLIGKSDEHQQTFPDIDLRAAVSPQMLEFVSRQSVQLTFDDSTQIWYALKTGQTRVLINEVEVGSQPIALNGDCWMRFYRANETPGVNRPIGEIRLTMEFVQKAGNAPVLPSGGVPVRVSVGIERQMQTLRASNNLPLGKVGTSLIQYANALTVSEMQLTLMRVLPPQTPVSALKPDEFLYAAISLRR